MGMYFWFPHFSYKTMVNLNSSFFMNYTASRNRHILEIGNSERARQLASYTEFAFL